MASYYNPSKRLSEWAAATLSPFIQLETQDGQTDLSRLSVGLWSGHVQLKNVELRPEAFDKYLNPDKTDYNEFGTKIRWKIVRGTIDDVSVSIPWKSLLMGTSYSSWSKNKKHEMVIEEQSEFKSPMQGRNSAQGEMDKCADHQEKDQMPKQASQEDEKTPSGCTTVQINGLCLILGYEVIHQDSLDAHQSRSSFQDDKLTENELKRRVREEKNIILQTAERRLLAGLDPFPPSLTESLEKGIKSTLQSSLEQTMSQQPPVNSSDQSQSNASVDSASVSTYSAYRFKVENFLTSTIKSLLWRTYDSLSVSVTHIRLSVVGSSHYDKKIRVLPRKGRVRKQRRQKPEKKPDSPKRHHRLGSLPEVDRIHPRFHHQRFISTDFWDENWQPYPSTITPVRRGRARKTKKNVPKLQEHSDEDSDYDSMPDADKVRHDEEEDVSIWSKEGYVEVGFVMDKLDVRPGLVSHGLAKQEMDGNKQTRDNDWGPMSVKHLHFRKVRVFLRRGPLSLLTAKKERDSKPRRTRKEKKLPWHDLEHDDFIVNPTNIDAECTFYRHSIDGDAATTITSTRTTKDHLDNNSRMGKAPHSHIKTSNKSHATSDTKRRAKREKSQTKSVEPSIFGSVSALRTIESNFTESYLMPKQLELKWTVGHVRSSVSSRHMYLMNSCLQSLSRLKRGRPSMTIRSAKAYDRMLIERMTEEGQPVITALDTQIYRILPQLRSTKYAQRTLLSLHRVVLSWWRYAVTCVILELKDRENLIDRCTGSSDKKQPNFSLAAIQRRRWDWQEQSKIRKEYIKLYLLVHGSPISDENVTRSIRASISLAESRLEEIENDLAVERILLLRKISRAASLSVNATDPDDVEAHTVSYYDFTQNMGQASAEGGVFEIATDVLSVHTLNATNSNVPATNKLQSADAADAVQGPIKISKSEDILLLCSSFTIEGFSLALCELRHPCKDSEESKCDEDDLSDDISALTGFSDSVDSSSLHQSSQQTAYEKFDPTCNFWAHDQSKLYHEPVLLLHISDISLCVQLSHLHRKFRVLIGGAVIQKDILSSSAVLSIGCIPGLKTPSKESLPQFVLSPSISALTICDNVSPASTFYNLKSSFLNIDWTWLHGISVYLSANSESRLRRNLTPMCKEQSLRRVAFSTETIARISLRFQLEAIQVTMPLSATDKETESVVLTLNALLFSEGVKETKQKPDEATQHGKNDALDDQDYEMVFTLDKCSIQMRLETSSIVELFQAPVSIQVRSPSTACCQPLIVDTSPVHLSISEVRVMSMSKLLKQILKLCSNDISDGEECIKPQLPAIAEYTLMDIRLGIESITLHVFSDTINIDSLTSSRSLSPQKRLREITTHYLSLVSCLDFQYPNQDAIECMTKLYGDQCTGMGLSLKDAGECVDAALSNYQSELRSGFGESSENVNWARLLDKINSCPDTIDRIIDRATEKTLSALVASLSLPEAGLFIRTGAVSFSWSTFYQKSMVQAKAKCLKIDHGSGVNLLDIVVAEVLPVSPDGDNMALVLSLSSTEINSNKMRQEIYFEVDNVQATFHPGAYLDALTAYQSFADTLIDSTENPNETSEVESTIDFVANGTLSSISVIVTDDFIPFARFRLSDLSFSKSFGGDLIISLSAKDVSLQCVSPTAAQTYPDIITTYQSEREGEDDCNERYAFTLHVTKENNATTGEDTTAISIFLDGVRITVIRQIVNEILQYLSAPEYGLGRLLKAIESHGHRNEASQDSNQVTVKVTNSSIVLPRDSNSIDLVGIEVEELTVSPRCVNESWNINSYSFRSNINSPAPSEAILKSSRSSASEVFFDCIDDLTPTAATPMVSRISVHLKGARLFTALNSRQHSPDKINLAFWNQVACCTGRSENSKRVYRAKMNSASHLLAMELRARVWKEVTLEPLNLIIKADSTPTLRLLIEMPGSSFLDMTMSQMYLMMSIWYSNMQQLPVLFPHDNAIVEESSMPEDLPANWPEYGSDDFVKQLSECCKEVTFEMSICISNLRLNCSYDPPGYFLKDPATLSMMGSDTISVTLERAICTILSDESHVLRVALGATAMSILDGRALTSFEQKASVNSQWNVPPSVDLNWGLYCGSHTLVDGLPLPFQVTVFMSPDNHCLINLGADMLEATLEDLSPIWILLDYFGLYFKDPAYGHPCFVADQAVQEAFDCAVLDDVCLDIDFRLWLTRPHVIIPSTSESHRGVCVMIESNAGIYYRYKSFGLAYSSQDIVTKDIAVVALREYEPASVSRGRRQVSGCLQSSGAQTLIDGLSFSIQYDFNESVNYTKFTICIPLSSQHFDRRNMDGIESSVIDVQPYQCEAPLVCKPFYMPSRNMGTKFTAYFSMEYMKLASELLSAFAGPKQAEDSPGNTPDDTTMPDLPTRNNLYSITAQIQGAELIISDPVMGMHRPILSISLPSTLITASQLQVADEKIFMRRSSNANDTPVLSPEATFDPDLQASVELCAFIDYFKLGKTRNWEPLVEPFKCLVLYENSSVRGQGVTINLDCPLHLNITSAAIETFDDAKDTFELFWLRDPSATCPQQAFSESPGIEYLSHDITFIHAQAEQINDLERRAFALKNNTGQQIRVHTRSSIENETIYYLDHTQTMPLSFPATITSIRNLKPIEVAVEDRKQSVMSSEKDQPSYHHLIDIQVPGFHWLHGVSIEETGRKFVELCPRSPQIQSKIDADWRLRNGLQLLADVQCLNGGRRLSLLSPFEIVNKTDHTISVSLSPDPRHSPAHSENTFDWPGFESEEVYPDQSYIVPHLLLERALRINGSHLGSLWVKPYQDDLHFNPLLMGNTTIEEMSSVQYPPRPIQFAKIVHETSVIWNNAKADPVVANQFASGTEISCPLLDLHGKEQQVAPFSYVVEVKRSPLAPQKTEGTEYMQQEGFSPSNITKGLKNAAKSKPAKSVDSALQHQPVFYSLLVHPPIVIENLLPERGRFELMHATNKSILWWAVLDPGEKVPVHTVSLSAPLLLLVNLGFCRTPVGEGALVHNGRVGEGLFKAGWNSLGQVMRTSKDKVKKTLFTVTESQDHRGAGRVSAVKNGINKQASATRKGQLGFSNENESHEMWYGNGLDAEVIDSELIVIDSLGQRLTLHIENAIGGGGQRFISLFCPYWIVNTTNHSLRYKQEKVSGFVSGTVLSHELDGSKCVDGSNRNDLNYKESLLGPYSTIFSGRPGALHSQNGDALEPAAVASLISEDLPLSILSSLAFMFNFQDTISLGSPPRLCVQLADTSDTSDYTSAWSSGFGLESVGVTQIVGMHCKEGRRLEVSISVAIAPGRLSNYTKIVRICPRYVIVNQLSRPIRLWQDNSMLHPNQPVEHSLNTDKSEKWIFSSHTEARFNEYKALFGEKIFIDRESDLIAETTAHHEACYISTIHPSELIAFHLPDTRIDRLLRIDYGRHWNLSSSIPADITGEYHLSISRAIDLRLLPHVSTRAAPIYTVTIPSAGKEWNGELGAYFETDWGRERTLIVKGVKGGSYASCWTDITVGDELIRIDDIPVEEFTFEDAMKLLKARLNATKDRPETSTQLTRPFQQRKKARSDEVQVIEPKGCVQLTFMTHEEKMRSLRRKVVVGRVSKSSMESRRSILSKHENLESEMQHTKALLVNMKFLFQSIFIFVQEPTSIDPPHIIRNRSLQWAIYYRQRNCEGHPWSCLYPGESATYTWQEPTKPKKMSLRVGVCEWITNKTDPKEEKARPKHRFSFQFIKDEEQGYYGVTKTVKLEEIGHMDTLPCPEKRKGEQAEKIYCIVDTEGTTRALIISDEIKGSNTDDQILIKRHLTNIRKEIASEEKRRIHLDAMNHILTSQAENNADNANSMTDNFQNLNLIESELQDIIDFGEGNYIERRHQVLVQVLEATGLVSSDLNGLSNPYVKVRLKTSAFKNSESPRSTYFVEKSLSPKWSQQTFVFNVPEKASDPMETRHISVLCTVKSVEKFGKDRFLGQAQIQLRDLLHQKESVGWYPLMGLLGQRDMDSVDRIRGSVKIRVHYISDYQALISYYLLCSERRIQTLKKTKAGMGRQLRALRETAKQQEEERESLQLAGVPALTMIGKKNKTVSYRHKQLELAKDDSFIQTSSQSFIQGVRGGTEQTLKKGIGIAKSVVQRGKRRDSNQNFGDAIDRDPSHFDLVDSFTSVHKVDIGDENDSSDEISTNSLVQQLTSSEVGITTRNAIVLPPTDIHINQGVISCSRLSSLRDRCKVHPLAVVSSNPSPFLSWNTSRAFMRLLKVSQSVSHSPEQNQKSNHDNIAFLHILKLPPTAPSIVKHKENSYVESLMSSRHLFSKKARRSIKSVVNPGGVLTIRPITALNLPDDFTGMFVKLRYGTTILVSETVDSRVSPVWTSDHTPQECPPVTPQSSQKRSILKRNLNSHNGEPSDFADLAEMVNPLARWGRPRKNDLQIEVAPFETSKSLRLSVIGERIQTSVELGILDIALGNALECCSQSLEEFEEDSVCKEPKGLPPAYVRWFPLTSPSNAIAVEGDMGKSVQPKESEKPRDDMFKEYFQPCIKLALMFKPHSDDLDEINEQSSPMKQSSTDQYLYAKLDRLSAALIDSNRINVGELLSFTSRDADLRLSITKAKTRVSFAVGNIQIDQQRMGQDSKAPVILAPTPVKHPQPLIQFLVWKDNTRSKKDIDSFEYVALEVQDVDLKLEENWLFDLWESYLDIVKSRERKERTKPLSHQVSPQFSDGDEEETSKALASAREFLDNPGEITASKKVYIKELILGYFKISLCYYKRNSWTPVIEDEFSGMARYELLSPSILSQRMSDKGGNSDEEFKRWSENTVFSDSDGGLSPSTINIVSAIIPSISDASISFQGKLIQHVFETQGDVLRSLRSHYSSEALKQIYKIVGSLDFVGNPSMLLTSFRTGLRDFILQPSRELKHITRNPSRVGVGVLKGTVSLFSNSTSGIFGFFSNIGSTAGQTATMFTFDENFQRHHSKKQTAQQRHYERWRRKGCGHIALMITRPVHDIVFGVLSASTGLLTEPYRGAKRNGVIGFGKGVGVGVLGLFVKPAVGFLDAFSHTMGSISDIAKSVNIVDVKFKPIERYRLPYTFGAYRMLIPFNQVHSKSAQLLLTYPIDKKSRRNDEIIVVSQALHVEPGWDQYIVVTTKRIVLFKLKDVDSTGFISINLDWQVRFEEGFRISSSLGTKGYQGTALYITKSSQDPKQEVEDFSSSSSDESDNFFQDQNSYEHGLSNNMERSYSISETPKTFRLRNPRLFVPNADAEGIQCFTIEGGIGHRAQLVQIHNAVCCLSGDPKSLIHDRHIDGDQGITSFGNLMFEFQGDTAASECSEFEDPKLSLSLLENAPWKYADTNASLTDI